MYDESTYELIQNFLREKLPAEEAEKMQRRIDNDREFAREVEWMKEFHLLMTNRNGVQLLDTFKEIHRKEQKKTQRIRWTIGIVAAFLLVILVFLLIRFFSEPQQIPEISPQKEPASIETETPVQPDKDTLPAPSVTPTKPPPEPIVETPPPSVPWEQYVTFREGLQTLGEEEDAVFDQAILLLDAGKRVEALPLLEKYLSSLPENEEDFEIRLEAGKIYLEGAKDYAKAAAHFQAVEQSDAILPFKLEASFYLALTYLAKGEVAQAEKQLRELSAQPSDPWQAKADQILESINKNR